MKIPQSRAGQYALLAFAVFVTRWIFRSKMLYDLDSVNFATGMQRFDIVVYQPHAPGYYLYVVLGRLFSLVWSDANDSLVAISIVFSCLGVIAIHRLTEELYDRRAAFAAGFIFLFSPLYWFHGIVALVYIIELFFAAVIGWLCWQTYSGQRDRSLLSAATLGLCLGFRQSAILFLGPLLFLSLRGKSLKQLVKVAAVFGAVCLAWFIPMAVESGGAVAYFAGLYDLWTHVAAKETAFAHAQGIPGASIAFARAMTILAIFALTFGFFIVGSLAQLTSRKRTESQDERDGKRSRFYLVWLIPGLLFFTLIFMRFVNSGYLLVLTPPLCAWLGAMAAKRYRPEDSTLRRVTPLVLAGLNIAIFLYAPVYCSRQDVLEFESRMREGIDYVRNTYDPDTTLIIGLDAHFHGFRHASYYLPEYQTVAYPSISRVDSVRLLAAREQDSRLITAPVELPFDQLVLFPMPHEGEYEARMKFLVESIPGLEAANTPEHVSSVGKIKVLEELYPLFFVDPKTAAHN
jgi:hypothetical protein